MPANYNQIVADLNSKQRQAVETTVGPVLVIAGPGSGKTRALAHRVAYLISAGLPGRAILAVTFTNKAAAEMAERIRALLGHKAGELPFIGTFHRLAASILRANASKIGFKPSFTIYDENDRLSLVKAVMKELMVSTERLPPGMVVETLNALKGSLISAEDHVRMAGDPFAKTIAKIYQTYQDRLKLSNALDFDDLIFFAVTLLKNNPAVRSEYQTRFRYVHVDEFQDVNPLEYDLVKLVAGAHKNLFVIGDDAQAIYSWRRASSRLMRNFEKDWPGTKVIRLEENYRSTPQILEAANHIISKNQDNLQKTLWTKNQPGIKPQAIGTASERDEAMLIAREILGLRQEKHIPWKGFAVLYRTNAQSRSLEEALIEKNIPYTIIGGVRFFERREIKDLLSYLRLVLNPDDIQAKSRAANVPPRGIGSRSLDALLSGVTETLPERNRGLVAEFQALLDALRLESQHLPLSRFLKELIKKIDYEIYLDDGSAQAESRLENIRELVSLAQRFDNLDTVEAIAALLEEVSLSAEQDELKESDDRVRLMTVHAAKGLEFPVVFLTGLEEGIFPHQKSLNASPQALEEERRLFYVAMTRAEKYLYFTWAFSRRLFGEREILMPSRFLYELPPEMVSGLEDSLGRSQDMILVEE